MGCTINYGRRGLWKQTENSRALTILAMWAKMTQHFPRCRLVGLRLFVFNRGPVAQLGARFHGMEEVVGSIPTRSTIFQAHTDSPVFSLVSFGVKTLGLLLN